MFTWKRTLLVSGLLLLDLGVFMMLSVLLMSYDDFYEGPAAEYGAWHTMTPFQRGVSLCHTFWLCANALVLVALLYRLVKRHKRRQASH